MNQYKLHTGDNKHVLKTFKDNSVDSIITDPPYELGFMGKSWDSTGIAYDVELWKECLRVLKPGGHILAFSGTRTYHRMTCAIEDAGFEVRDMIEWVYGSGFPKSLDIAKQIDKRGGKSVSWFGKWLRDWREKENIPQREVSKLFPSRTGGLTGCVANWELGLNMPTNEQFNLICKTFNLPFESLEEAEREIIGTTITNKTVYQNIGGTNISGEIDITKGTSEYEGWGTALKPAHEPICMARKPLSEKTVAENCLKWGTGGINIDESRVGYEKDDLEERTKRSGINCLNKEYDSADGKEFSLGKATVVEPNTQGRFPANLIHDNSEEVRECFPETGFSKGGNAGVLNNKVYGKYGTEKNNDGCGFGDSGNASRFFKSIIYQAKPSKAERNRGCVAVFNLFEQSEGVKQEHPTVKPIALMEYLIKMITPKGGVVLDPFNGSGSTGCAAVKNGFEYIGIDITPEYITISDKRIKSYIL